VKLTSLLRLWMPFGGSAAPAAPATAYTLAGPAIGLVGVASDPFTVTPDGVFSGTITPSDGGAGGSFVPASLTWAGTAGAKTFFYTPVAAGLVTVATSAAGALADPDPLTYQAVAGGTSNHTRRSWGVALEASALGSGGTGIY
jgi:hypothetical protein